MSILLQDRLPLYTALALLLGSSLAVLASPKPAPNQAQDYEGKVVPLSGLLKKFGARLDADAAPHWLALVTKTGKVYPLIQDDGARMFFKDQRLLNRPMRLTGRLYPDTHLLQVLSVRSIVKGQLCNVYYWCEICRIKRYEKKHCDCCGGPMELVETPVKDSD